MKALFAIAAVVFFATPVAARVVGVKAEPFENRGLAEAPSLDDGWNVFDRATRFLTDRMPLREEAVRANTRISQDLFDTTPRYGEGDGRGLPFAGSGGRGPEVRNFDGFRVATGRDGWLYLADEPDRACTPPFPRDAAVRRWRQLSAIVRGSGRRAAVVVAPDKYTVHPEHLPLDEAKRRCARRGGAALWKLIESVPRDENLIGLREPLLRLKRSRGEPVYLRTDSHWTPRGAFEMVSGVLDRLGRGVRPARGELVDLGSQDVPGDLNGLVGDPTPERRRRLEVRRRPGAPKVPGRTVFVLDSFGEKVTEMLPPYFETVELVYWNRERRTSRAQLAAAVERADTVVFEAVEREFAMRAGNREQVNAAFLQRLRELPRR